MKEYHAGRMRSLIGRLVQVFGVKTASADSSGVQDEDSSPHTSSANVLSGAHPWVVARNNVAELEFRKSQALLERQRISLSK